MKPRIEKIAEKRFIGKKKIMSFSNHNPYELWRSFMPRRGEIENKIGNELYSMEVYPPQFFEPFDREAAFVKWAAVEVTDFNTIPDDMESLYTPGGLYAVFIHKGPSSDAAATYHYIFSEWLPDSGYRLDDRPHFAIMGEKYRKDDPDSEEEVWIPVERSRESRLQ